MSHKFAPGSYYRLTWLLELAVVGALIMASNAARLAIIVPFILLSMILVSSLAGRTSKWRQTVSYGLLIALIVVAIDRSSSLRDIDSFIGMMIELIMGALPFMLLNSERPRSYWLATLTISVIAVGSISLTSDPAVYAGFIVFMILLLLNLNAANLHLSDAAGQRLSESLPTSYFRQFFYVMPIGLVAAVVIFVVFPRARSMSLGFEIGLRSQTGYSGAISLSGDGEIEPSERVTLLIGGSGKADFSILKRSVNTLLVRGDSLDTFDGSHWSSTVADRKSRQDRPDVRVALATGRLREFIFHQEPTTDATVFYPGSLVDIINRSVNMGDVIFNANGSAMRRNPKAQRIDYTARFLDILPLADVGTQTLAELAAAAAGDVGGEPAPFTPSLDERRLDLAIPESVAAKDYFKAWLNEFPIDKAHTTLAEAVAALDRHFREKFTASLANEFAGGDALAAFLGPERRGHCEYFATATVLFLRSFGIPARVVVGYKGATYNRFIDLFEVREANAHAWAEVLVPGKGWFPVDLTPAGGAPATNWLTTARLYGTAVSFWFRRYVVDYDFESQRSIVDSIRGLGASDHDEPIDWKKEFLSLKTPLALLTILVAFAIFHARRLLRRQTKMELPLYYRKFQALAAKRHLRIATGETLHAFHSRVREAGVTPGLVDEVDSAIERDLYSQYGTERGERLHLLRALEMESFERRA